VIHTSRVIPRFRSAAASAAGSASLVSAMVWATFQEPAQGQSPAAAQSPQVPVLEEREKSVPNDLPKMLFAPPVINAPAADEPTLEELVEGARSSYRPLLVSELRFIRKACGLSEHELKPIVRHAALLLKEVAATVATAEQKRLRNLGKAAHNADEPGPEAIAASVKPLLSGLEQAVRTHVSPARWSRYEDESARRRNHRMRVAISNVVALLDFHLLLSDQQRSQLSASLASHWKNDWLLFVVVTSDNDSRQVPPIPDLCVVPFLTENQQKLWRRFNKQPQDPYWTLLEFASEIATDQGSEFDSELGKPRVDANLGDVPVN
jgi:hypothetical protein